jgi:CheY-like chemotaxis protein
LTLVVDLPKAPMWVLGDATRLSQVVTNLLHNAAKFTDPGGTVVVLARRSASSAVLSVRDTGIGIAPAELAHIFEPFRQAASNLVRSRGGLGVGLALATRLIEKHHGAMTAASEGLGCGSVFSIQLPLELGLASAPVIPTTEAAAPWMSHRVLIVDDRRDARLTLSTLLKRMGQEVVQAEDGAAAVHAAGDFHPDIVLCDIGLPDIDGYAVAQAIRANPLLDGVYLVALTGYGRAEDRARALAAGFDEHLAKPVGYGQLVDLLRVRESHATCHSSD